MKMKYCPNCAGISIRKNDVGMDACVKCHYSGTMNEGAIDEINSFVTRLKNGSESRPTQATRYSEKKLRDGSPTPNLLKEKLKSLKGKSTDDYEFL